MEKKKSKIFNLRNTFVFLTSLLIGTIIFLILFYSNTRSLYDALNSSFIVAMIEICIGLLFFSANSGTFDIFALGFANLFATRKLDGHKKYDGLYDYREQKREARKSGVYATIPLVSSGLIFLILSFIFLAIWKASL